MDLGTPRGVRFPALSLTSIASKLAPTGGQRRCRRPRRASTAGMPSPTQLSESHTPSPSNAANSPAALSTAMTVGMAKTFRKFDCRGFMPRSPLFPAQAWQPCAAPPTGRLRCRAQ
ncbi:hypothetical protein C1X65_16345 [Pseudomonas sp. FW305-70]|nr:hypothetical protein C1X65_16345 [Pseudomonas sp. FW305-70]